MKFAASVFTFLYVLALILGFVGWGMNIYKMAQLDFQAPYKAEVLRVIGIPVFPMGAIEGYMTIKDQK